ncbi:MAG TPA: hypothetical protein VFQ65_33670 [Kofleriaceae bacterium]|nr:hypothetical protein [Kofleriaceae bacterium]
MDPRADEARRLLDRYLVEIVETYDLCPWAKTSRTGGELAVEFLWGTPSLDEWLAAAARAFADPAIRVAMLVAPELAITRQALHGVRDQVAKHAPTLGIAEFHPDATYDGATPARLVPFLRRSPDPLLQCVPLALLDQLRGPPLNVDRSEQIAMLVKAGGVEAVKPPLVDRIALQNHARVVQAEVEAKLAAIAADRAESYARVGISTSRSS